MPYIKFSPENDVGSIFSLSAKTFGNKDQRVNAVKLNCYLVIRGDTVVYISLFHNQFCFAMCVP